VINKSEVDFLVKNRYIYV